MDLVTAIKVELARKNMRMFQLADLLGLSRVSLSKKMNGHTEFTVGELYNLADTFGMSASELLSNAENEKEKARSSNCGQ